MTDGSIDLGASLIVRQSAFVNLKAAFWVARYPTPLSIEPDLYGAVLIIDPNGLRADNKGPIEFLVDSSDFTPGITAKSGFMTAILNDNNNSKTGSAAHTDLYLLRSGTELIRDDDEFWIGVQRGPLPGGTDPIEGEWDPTDGPDGKGAGRKILMGGFISKRFYSIANKKITATIVGKDYLEIWNDQPYGTPLAPKEYKVAQDVGFIVEDLIATINSMQTAPAPLRADGWYYYKHPTYWPTRQATVTVNIGYTGTVIDVDDTTGFQLGPIWIYDSVTPAGEYDTVDAITPAPLSTLHIPIPGITNILGYHIADGAIVKQSNLLTRWTKTFKQDPARDIMSEICDESLYEWLIDYHRYVRLFPRNGGPIAPNLKYGENVRDVQALLMGDTSDRITHLITQGLTTTIPASTDLWCTTPNIWYDPTNAHRTYARYSFPPPANPVDAIYTDVTLIQDDEGESALCFQNDIVFQFNLHFGMKINNVGNYVYPALAMDLREIRRLKFKFRHATYDGTPGCIYRVEIMCRMNDGWYFDFGQGVQEALGVSEHDTIDSAEHTLIDLLLPECDEAGNIIDLHGWIEIDDPATPEPDPTAVNWPAFMCSLAEANPGRGPGQFLSTPAAIGDDHIHVPIPQQYIGLAAASPVTDTFFYQPQSVEIVEGATTERVTVSKMDSGVLYLTPPHLVNNFTVAAKAYVRGGWTVCFSQFRFERQLRYESSGVLAPPYRYKILATSEVQKLTELISRSDGMLQIFGDILYGVEVTIDGNPEFEVGTRPRVYFGTSLYENLRMVVDEAAYHVAPGDFSIDLSLGLVTARSTSSSDYDVLAAHEKQLRDIKSSQDLARGDE